MEENQPNPRKSGERYGVIYTRKKMKSKVEVNNNLTPDANKIQLPARFGKVRRSGRISKNTYSKKFKNTLQTPIVLDDSDYPVTDGGKDSTSAVTGNVITRRPHQPERPEDSDDDFVNPPAKKPRFTKGMAARISQRTKQMESEKDQPVSLTKQQYEYYVDEKIKLRFSTHNMCIYLRSLNSKQKKAIEDIGFGSVLGFKLDSIPTNMGYWLVKNYDPDACVLNLGSHQVHITPRMVHTIFGIPLGKKRIEEQQRPRDSDDVVKEWKAQFDGTVKRVMPFWFRNYLAGMDDIFMTLS